MARRRKSRYQGEQDRADRRYRATLALMRRAERFLTRVVEGDRVERQRYGSQGALSDKQYDNVNTARWKLAAAFRRK